MTEVKQGGVEIYIGHKMEYLLKVRKIKMLILERNYLQQRGGEVQAQ